MTQFVIGVDGGGSKTEAVILNERGEILGLGRSGSSNYHLVGIDGARKALLAAMQKAATAANVNLIQASAVTWALAGAGRPADVRLLENLQSETLPRIPGKVVTDAVAALIGGVGTHRGIVLIAGTGMIVYGENGADISARAGGWGYIIDQGNGYHLVREALQAVARAADGSDLPTRLQQRLLDTLHLKKVSDLVSWLYAQNRQVAEVAALAPIVLEEAESRDPIATAIIAQAADALAANVEAVARRLRFDGETTFPLVLTGGLLNTGELYRQTTIQSVHTRLPGARAQIPRHSAVVGAGLMALELLGISLVMPTDVSNATEESWASERNNVLTRDLDLRTTLELTGLMHVEDCRAVAAVRPNLPTIAHTIDAIAARMEDGGRLIYVGAGTSGRLGVLDASECPPTFNSDPEQVVGVIAGGEPALTSSVEEAEDDPEAGAQAIAALKIGKLDSVVGIAASGRTPYVIGALEEARRRGALTVALTCNLPAPLAQMTDFVIAPLVGPEVIGGSTRLKAGTAQKLILNMLSTGVMVRLGKTYGNLMVDVQQLNTKLQERSRRIVAQACHITEKEAAAALAQCDGDVKTAIVSILRQCSPEEARQRLAQAGGRVRFALSDGY